MISNKGKLRKASSYVVVDVYFAKYKFVKGLQEQGFHLVSRFLDDAVLFYPTIEKPTGKKGRPKLYDGKIDLDNPIYFLRYLQNV